MSAVDVFFLIVWWLSIACVGVAGFLYGWRHRDENPPHPAVRSVVEAVLDRPRPLVFVLRPVHWHELPAFLRLDALEQERRR
jgi:hypothetical protein